MRRGTTLIELLVVLAIIGVALSLSALSLRTASGSLGRPARDSQASSLDRAVRSGTMHRTFDSVGRIILLLPDGRVVRTGGSLRSGAR